mmetsp:Transcript_22495/g.73069  ORF Transcript_22495/g.73069 Transcript_22495/m.73069 type:complete len:1150 (-) Transcript_22495:209-3658(-)
MEEPKEGKDFSFAKEEEAILELWDRLDAFQEQLRRTEGQKEYIFYDGPPFATGLPHYGHILAGTIKDVVTRYASVTGYHVTRRFGWDCHGLPVEYEIDKKLGIKGKDDVMKLGIDKYNEECRSIVMRYSKEWEKTVKRVGRWIDFERDYKTMDVTFMESIWWVFKSLNDKGLVYRGFKVMPYSTTCNTPLSNFEAGLDYRDVSDPSVMVKFPIIGAADGAALVAWTTTPWTLPSNLALCVHPEFTYVKVKATQTGELLIVAKARLPFLPGNKGKKKKDAPPAYEVVEEMTGATLKDTRYEPLFGYFAHLQEQGAFRVVCDTYVTDDGGTGVVHQAPAYGEDDNRVCLANGVVKRGGELPDPVDANGCFGSPVEEFKGLHVKAADKEIIAAIKAKGRLVEAAVLVHSYPFCWRSHTPLIYKAVPSFFVHVTAIKDRLIANNKETHWVPSYVKENRFHNWLENAHDWAVSRNRYWGTPIPVWRSDDGEEEVVIGSIKELEELTGAKITDIHRHFIDHLTIPSKRGPEFGVLKRVEDVFDCWFESGSMPYSQLHYPFENKELFENNFPADFIAEGLDQTRGWFYTLMVLSTALFDRPAFKNLVCNGLVLAADGKKMSKSLKNYPDPNEVVQEYGADALRLYLVNSPVVRAEPLKFQKDGVFSVLKDVFLPWYNAYRFLCQNIIEFPSISGRAFNPEAVSPLQSPNVLDRWIYAASQGLLGYIRKEMEGYRLYTVCPRLVSFIEQLTNIYVRLNRKRLKSKVSVEDGERALCTLFQVLLTLCKAMGPLTPFFTETMYQNLRRVLPEGAEESLHFCTLPEPNTEAFDERIETSVTRMQTILDLGRVIRERSKLPTKIPLKKLIVVHADATFLADIAGDLRAYTMEELNVQELEVCADINKYATVRAEPNWNALGKRLGKQMGAVAKAIKSLDQAAVAAFEASGSIEVAGHALGKDDLKVVREFKQPAGSTPETISAEGDGDVLVVLYLEVDQSMEQAGFAREVNNRYQKLRKKAGLNAADEIEIFYSIAEDQPEQEKECLRRVFKDQRAYFKETWGSAPFDVVEKPAHAAVLIRDAQSLSNDARFDLCFTLPALGLSSALEPSTAVFLASLDPKVLKDEGATSVSANIDGKRVSAALGVDYWPTVSEAIEARAQ